MRMQRLMFGKKITYVYLSVDKRGKSRHGSGEFEFLGTLPPSLDLLISAARPPSSRLVIPHLDRRAPSLSVSLSLSTFPRSSTLV